MMTTFKTHVKSVLSVVGAPIILMFVFGVFIEGFSNLEWGARISNIYYAVKLKAASNSGNPNMVDERFELLSVVFRFAGRVEYGDTFSSYQRNVVRRFRGSRNISHAAVRYAAELPLGYDAVFKYAVHLDKNKFGSFSIKDMDSLIEDGRWTREVAEEFLGLLNKFYVESYFSEFYFSQLGFYEAETERFFQETYKFVNFDWFRTYINPVDTRVLYSPSSTRYNYGSMLSGNIVYVVVTSDGSALIHELCHSFANPLAVEWYRDNPQFRAWSDDSVDFVLLPYYAAGEVMAMEYVTRAYNILYEVDHGRPVLPLILQEKGQGFPYIENVYALITPHEIVERSKQDILYAVFGLHYDFGPEDTAEMRGETILWRPMFVPDLRLEDFRQSEIGGIFDSQMGDILYVDESYVLIDLGEFVLHGQSGLRRYSRIPLN